MQILHFTDLENEACERSAICSILMVQIGQEAQSAESWSNTLLLLVYKTSFHETVQIPFHVNLIETKGVCNRKQS